MNAPDYAQEIVSQLKKEGMSTDYILGYLQSVISGLQKYSDEKVTHQLASQLRALKSY